jgi:tetratricopeptide (TPR) repeat protein
MITPMVDKDGSATRTSAEGEMALATGDTALAREKFAAAGEILLRNMGAVYKAADKHLLRFLAATQFYKGGHYQRALDLSEKIQARLLPKNVRDLLPPFLRDVKHRSSSGYVVGIRQRLIQLWEGKRPNEILVLLQDHPYVFRPAALAYFRAVACEDIGDFRAAALFFADAIRGAPSDGLISIPFVLAQPPAP